MNKSILKVSIWIIFAFFFSFSTSSAWIGLIAENGDLLNITKWNEMITELDTKLAPSRVYGSWAITITSSGTTDIVIGLGGVAGINTESVTVADGSCLVTTTDHNRFMNAYVEIVVTTPGAELVPTGTIDPDNTSTGDAQVIDNNYSSLTYNNSSSGTANKSLPAVDLGASLAAWLVRIYWWTPATYGVTNGSIQWSNDGITWVNLVTWIVKTTGATWDFDDYTVSGSYRYYRLYSVTWLNATWVTLAELEVFSIGTTTTNFINIFHRNMEIKNNGGKVELCNNDGATRTVEINSLQ